MAIAVSHGGTNIYSAPEPSREVLVGTKDGIAILARDNGGWKLVHRALTDQHISSITFERQSGTIFAGAFWSSVFASTDGGYTWERRDNGIRFHDVFSMNVGTYNGKPRVFAGTEPANLYYTDDLGYTWYDFPTMREVKTVDQWSFPGAPHIAHTKFITFDPRNEHVIYSCIEQGALLRSEDDGQTWRELNVVGFLQDTNRKKSEVYYDVHKALIDPRNERIYVSGGAGLYVTEDLGKHWDRWMTQWWAPDVYPDALVLRPSDPDTVVVAAASHNPATWRTSKTAEGKVFRTRDAGKTWELLTDGWPESTRQEVGGMTLEDWGDSFSLYAATTAGELYVSDDGGDHWTLALESLTPISKKGHYMNLFELTPGGAQYAGTH
jgi:photosystem II stability/assembly factor-like uncharacterized protein